MIPTNIQRAIDRKPVYAEPDHRPQSTHPEPEPAFCHEQVGAQQTQEGDSGGCQRIQVRVVSYRRRLLDEDNLCPKYAIDALRYEGLLPSDAPQFTTIQTSQVQVDSAALERTEVTLSLEDTTP